MRSSSPKMPWKMASRKGVEPLTPGLGNLCSILLSYRDPERRPIIARPKRRVSESWKAAVLWMGLVAAAPSQACGTMTATVELRGVTPAGDLVLGPGGVARLAGLALDERAVAKLRTRVGQTLAVASLAPSPDRWGRRAVDLFDANGRSLSLGFLENGDARVRAEPETRGCESERLEAEQGARLAGEGLWADSGAVLDAADLKALAGREGQFTLVRGRVRRTGATSSRIYLDFEPSRGLSVVVARKLETQFRRAGRDVMDLAGRMVLVRGVLDNRFGPRIEIADPAMIEPLESAKESNRGG